MKRQPFLPSDPNAGMTLDDLAEFVAEMMGTHELPGATIVRCTGLIEFDMDGSRIARLTACPEEPDTKG